MRKSIYIITGLVALTFSTQAQELTSGLLERSQIDEKYRWDTRDVYPDFDAWDKDYRWVESQLPAYASFRGTLGDAGQLLPCLQFDEKVMRKRDRLWLFAKLQRDVEMQNTLYREKWSRQNVLNTKHQVARSFIEPEIISLPEGQIEKMMIEEEGLVPYTHYLEVLKAKREHTLTPDKEEFLTSVTGILDNPYEVFGNLVYAELPFPVITDEQGNEMMLNRTNSWRARSSTDRKVRKTGYQEYYRSLGKYQGTLVANLNGFVSGKVLLAKNRHYSNALEASLDRYSIPEDVYHNLIVSVEKNLQPMHRWIRMKKELLGLDTLYMYDTRVTAFRGSRQTFTWEEAEQMTYESLNILGNDYMQPIDDAYTNRWIDAFPNVGKETGGYSSGTAEPHPYVKMNWGGELFDFYTLVHELGHFVHAFNVMEKQPHIYWESPSFINEVASTTAENIAQSYLIENAGSKEEKLYQMEQYLDYVILLIYNSCMMAEFELKIYEWVENGGSLSAEKMNQYYRQLLSKYYGPEVTLEEVDTYAWMEYPHYYLDYYLFSYATSFTAAIQIASDIKNEGEAATDRFLDFLEAGNSDYPVEVLKKAGVNMTSSLPYESVAVRLNEMMDEMEALRKDCF